MLSLEKIMSYTEKVGDCLEWTRCLNTDGYPRAVIDGNNNGKVHRYVFFLVNGYYPPVVRHKCDNPVCINPDHLEGGTVLDNVRDRNERRRTYNHVTEELLNEVKSAKADGFTYQQIADKFNIKKKRVDYILNSRGGY